MLENSKNLTCEFSEELVSYLYNELTGTDKTRFEKHLGKCPPCTLELSEFSMTSSAVQEWRNEEFLPLIPPTIEIPYHSQTKTIGKEGVSRSWLIAVRDFFTLSPAWTTAATAFATLVICVGLYLVMFSSLPEDRDVTVQQTKNGNIKVSPTPTTGSDNSNSNLSEPKETGQKPTNSPKPLLRDPKLIATDPVKGSTVTKPQNLNIKKQVQPNAPVRITKQPKQTAPSLLDEEEEDDTLRLSDLLEGIGDK